MPPSMKDLLTPLPGALLIDSLQLGPFSWRAALPKNKSSQGSLLPTARRQGMQTQPSWPTQGHFNKPFLFQSSLWGWPLSCNTIQLFFQATPASSQTEGLTTTQETERLAGGGKHLRQIVRSSSFTIRQEIPFFCLSASSSSSSDSSCLEPTE